MGKPSPEREPFNARGDAESFKATTVSELRGGKPQARRATTKMTLGDFIVEHERTRTGPKGRRLKGSTVALHISALEWFARLHRITNAANRQTLMALAARASITSTMAHHLSATENQIDRLRRASRDAQSKHRSRAGTPDRRQFTNRRGTGNYETRPAGLEPATYGLGNRCSVLLSYGRILPIVHIRRVDDAVRRHWALPILLQHNDLYSSGHCWAAACLANHPASPSQSKRVGCVARNRVPPTVAPHCAPYSRHNVSVKPGSLSVVTLDAAGVGVGFRSAAHKRYDCSDRLYGL